VYPIRIGISTLMSGPITDAICTVNGSGSTASPSTTRPAIRLIQPVLRKSEVIRPKAMNAPRFGMTIPARNAPARCTCALAPVPETGGVNSDMVTGTPSYVT
jgi:hypothetical protein